jgi:hypothetical protein
LFEVPNICFNTEIKFGGGGPAEGWFAVLDGSLLIFHLNFFEFYRVKEATKGWQEKISCQRTNSKRLTYIKLMFL